MIIVFILLSAALIAQCGEVVKMNDEQRTQLEEQGYLIFKSRLSRTQIEGR
jgi:hypothetical protein